MNFKQPWVIAIGIAIMHFIIVIIVVVNFEAAASEAIASWSLQNPGKDVSEIVLDPNFSWPSFPPFFSMIAFPFVIMSFGDDGSAGWTAMIAQSALWGVIAYLVASRFIRKSP